MVGFYVRSAYMWLFMVAYKTPITVITYFASSKLDIQTIRSSQSIIRMPHIY